MTAQALDTRIGVYDLIREDEEFRALMNDLVSGIKKGDMAQVIQSLDNLALRVTVMRDNLPQAVTRQYAPGRTPHDKIIAYYSKFKAALATYPEQDINWDSIAATLEE